MSRSWIKKVSEIDRDCILQWENFLNIRFFSYEEYAKVDKLIDEMVLEYDSISNLTETYPDILTQISTQLNIPEEAFAEELIVISKEKWDSIYSDYKGTWQNYHEDHPEWLGRKVVMSGCINPSDLGKLLIEGIHFIVEG